MSSDVNIDLGELRRKPLVIMAEDLGRDGISLQELFTRGRGIQRRLENDEISPTLEEGKVCDG